ncbi:MAG: hypothetical protein HYX73_03780 [Acidobacteria bacterium]|nr:hypothetical protein [Acidobacteriota bacterium]
MAEKVPQTFENHARFVPAYHFVLFGILLINLGWSVYRLYRTFSFETIIGLLLAFGLMLLFFFARIFALRVQDRVIRLEMRLRMEKVLPADLQPRILEFTPSQLIALRFASDAELPELARRVLTEKIEDRRAIKKLIQQWNPDYLRV